MSLSVIAAKDSAGTAIAGGLQAQDKSGSGAGPFTLGQVLLDGAAGVNMAAVTAAGALKVDGSAVTQPVSIATAPVLVAGAAVIGKVGVDQTTDGTTNAIRLLAETTKVIGTVNVAAGQTIATTNAGTFAVQATLQASAATAIGKVDPNTIGTWGLQVATQNSATPTNSKLVSGQFNTTPTTITSGNVSPLQLDSAGNLLVNIKAGAGSGGTAIADEAAFTEGTTSFTPIGGVFKTSHTALTTGQAGVLALTAAREALTVGKVWDGTNTAAVKAASTAPLATDPALVVAISPNSVNANISDGSAQTTSTHTGAPVVPIDPYSQYETVAASATAQVMGATGGQYDYIAGVLIIPATTAAGAVSITDGNGSAITIFAGGGTTALADLKPFLVPLGLHALAATTPGWKITTGTNVSAIGIGKFT